MKVTFLCTLFSPDDAWILTLSAWEGMVRIWPSDPLPLARARKPRNLTLEERRKFGIESEAAVPPENK